MQDGIKWTFNPPLEAHHGGVWEQLVQDVKKVLCTVVKQQVLDDEALHTALCEVEAVLNDRPITPFSDDPNGLEALTQTTSCSSKQSHVYHLACLEKRTNTLAGIGGRSNTSPTWSGKGG